MDITCYLKADLSFGSLSAMRLPADSSNETSRGLVGSVESNSSAAFPDALEIFEASPDSKAAASGHLNGHGRSLANGNGALTSDLAFSRKLKHHSRSNDEAGSSVDRIQRVNLPGTRLYDDSCIDREEFIRLVVQSLRDVGYLCVIR